MAMSSTPSAEQPQGTEPILPAVLEFPEHHQDQFLRAVITELDVNSPNFKLAPVYTLYLCAR
jgi:afadin